MKLTIKPAASDYLAQHDLKDARIFLALDDGSSKYSQVGGSCAIGNKYQLVVSQQADADYAVPLENEQGYHLTTGEPETDFFSHGLTLDYKNASLALRDDSGILDGAVMLTEAPAQPATDEEQRANMKSLGNKIC